MVVVVIVTAIGIAIAVGEALVELVEGWVLAMMMERRCQLSQRVRVL